MSNGKDHRPPINLNELEPPEPEKTRPGPGRLEYIEPQRRMNQSQGPRQGPKAAPNYGLVFISVLLSVSLVGVLLIQFYPSKSSLSGLYAQANSAYSAVKPLQDSIGVLRSDLTNSANRLESALTSISTLPKSSDLLKLSGDLNLLKDSLARLEGSVPTKAQVAEIEAKVASLSKSLSEIKIPDITSIQADVMGLKTKISSIESLVSGNASQLVTMQASITTLQSSLASIQGSLSAFSVKLTSFETLLSGFQMTPPQKAHIVSVNDSVIQAKIDSAGSYVLVLRGYGEGEVFTPIISLGTFAFSFLEEDEQLISSLYGVGRAGFVSGSDTVIGNTGGQYRTYWNSSMIGGTIRRAVSSSVYEIVDVDPILQKITLSEPYDGATVGNVTYVIEYFSESGNVCYTVGIKPPTGGWKVGDVVGLNCSGCLFDFAEVSEGVGDS